MESVTGEEQRFDDSQSRLIATIKNYSAELEREKISSRTHERLRLLAGEGANAGGRCYGYDNVPVMGTAADGTSKRLRVEYGVNDREALVVRRIFKLYVEGWGLKRIARQLNRESVPSPRAGKRGTGSWSPSSIDAMLSNERYRGVVPYNRWKKTYRDQHTAPAPRLGLSARAWSGCASLRQSCGSSTRRCGSPHETLGREARLADSSRVGPRHTSSRASCAAASAGDRSRSVGHSSVARR
jgi:hypothetical protein